MKNHKLQETFQTFYDSLNTQAKELTLQDFEEMYQEVDYISNLVRDQINQKLLEITTDEEQ